MPLILGCANRIWIQNLVFRKVLVLFPIMKYNDVNLTETFILWANAKSRTIQRLI